MKLIKICEAYFLLIEISYKSKDFISNKIEDLKIEKQEFVKKITVIEKENYIKIFNFYIIYLLLTI
jgi:hypothetical protein